MNKTVYRYLICFLYLELKLQILPFKLETIFNFCSNLGFERFRVKNSNKAALIPQPPPLVGGWYSEGWWGGRGFQDMYFRLLRIFPKKVTMLVHKDRHICIKQGKEPSQNVVCFPISVVKFSKIVKGLSN